MNTIHPIKHWRLVRRMRQSQLAKMAGISNAHLSHIEAGGRLSLDVAQALVAATDGDVTLDALAAARKQEDSQ